tara:strand:+ start:6346 stop:6519 length:174 start_codon:yes stop_codon:yes gene_type:complete
MNKSEMIDEIDKDNMKKRRYAIAKLIKDVDIDGYDWSESQKIAFYTYLWRRFRAHHQ